MAEVTLYPLQRRFLFVEGPRAPVERSPHGGRTSSIVDHPCANDEPAEAPRWILLQHARINYRLCAVQARSSASSTRHVDGSAANRERDKSPLLLCRRRPRARGPSDRRVNPEPADDVLGGSAPARRVFDLLVAEDRGEADCCGARTRGKGALLWDVRETGCTSRFEQSSRGGGVQLSIYVLRWGGPTPRAAARSVDLPAPDGRRFRSSSPSTDTRVYVRQHPVCGR